MADLKFKTDVNVTVDNIDTRQPICVENVGIDEPVTFTITDIDGNTTILEFIGGRPKRG